MHSIKRILSVHVHVLRRSHTVTTMITAHSLTLVHVSCASNDESIRVQANGHGRYANTNVYMFTVEFSPRHRRRLASVTYDGTMTSARIIAHRSACHQFRSTNTRTHTRTLCYVIRTDGRTYGRADGLRTHDEYNADRLFAMICRITRERVSKKYACTYTITDCAYENEGSRVRTKANRTGERVCACGNETTAQDGLIEITYIH